MCKVYISFYKLKKPKNRKTDVWEVITLDKTELGHIKFSGAWRQFIFEPASDTFWNYGCLEQITEFLKRKNNDWKKSLKKRNKK